MSADNSDFFRTLYDEIRKEDPHIVAWEELTLKQRLDLFWLMEPMFEELKEQVRAIATN